MANLLKLLLGAGIVVLFLAVVALAYPWFGLLLLFAWIVSKGGKWKGSGWSHGTARFASLLDAARGGLLARDGPILGRANLLTLPRSVILRRPFPLSTGEWVELFLTRRTRRILRINKYVHLLTCAPTGRGKGVSVIIPNLLSHRGSIVITDPKGENHKITADFRRNRFGHRIIVADPFGITGQEGDSFNILDFIDAMSDSFLDDCRDVADMLVVRTGEEREPHWNDAAVLVLTSFIAWICACEGDPAKRNLDTVRLLVSSRDAYTKAIETMQKVESHGGVVKRLGGLLTWFVDRELGGVLTTVQRHTAWMDGPVMARALATTSFDPRELRSKRGATAYICLPHDKLTSLAAYNRLWVGMLLKILTRGQPTEENEVLFLLDEIAHIGRIKLLEDAVTLFRGMGIRLWFFVQSIAQISKFYSGEPSAFLDNIDTQQFFGLSSIETAKAVSELIGETTIVVSSYSETHGESRPDQMAFQNTQPGTISTSRTYNFNEHGRALLRPEEIRVLGDTTGLVLHRNMPVVPVELIRYFDDPDFRGLVPAAKQGRHLSPAPAERPRAKRRPVPILFLALAVIAAGLYPYRDRSPSIIARLRTLPVSRWYGEAFGPDDVAKVWSQTDPETGLTRLVIYQAPISRSAILQRLERQHRDSHRPMRSSRRGRQAPSPPPFIAPNLEPVPSEISPALPKAAPPRIDSPGQAVIRRIATSSPRIARPSQPAARATISRSQAYTGFERSGVVPHHCFDVAWCPDPMRCPVVNRLIRSPRNR